MFRKKGHDELLAQSNGNVNLINGIKMPVHRHRYVSIEACFAGQCINELATRKRDQKALTAKKRKSGIQSVNFTYSTF
jgi:hypothetical protein